MKPSIVLESATVVLAEDPSTGTPEKTILKPISLSLAEQRIGIIGANGSGKSTLLRLLNGLVLTTGGQVLVNGLDPRTHGASVRRQVGFVFTDPLSQLVMPTPLEDVELSLRRLKLSRADRREKALEVLRNFGLAELARNSVFDLSGGERQLVALATVLAVDPQILVLDEPSTLLDLRNTRMLGRLLATLPQQTIMATHDLELASQCQRILVVEDSRIAFDGPADAAIAWYRNQVN